MRPHRIQVSSSRCDRFEEAEELDTSEEPLLRREPLMDLMDFESASSSLHEERERGQRSAFDGETRDEKAKYDCFKKDGGVRNEQRNCDERQVDGHTHSRVSLSDKHLAVTNV